MNGARCQQTGEEAAAARISRALDALREEFHPIENVLQAFAGIFIEKACLKAGLGPAADELIRPPDPSRFQQGVPLAPSPALIQFTPEQWRRSAERLLPALLKGFPKLEGEIRSIEHALESGWLDPQHILTAAADGQNAPMEHAARELEVDPRSLSFVFGQIMKPLVEKRAEGLEQLIEGLPWHKGYCPICGSMPELAFLKGDEGQRWLRCSFCGHHWRFVRIGCPFCANDDQESLVIQYIAGREQERAEVCNACGRYVLCIDLRGRLDESILEVAAIGMVHLDVLAQEKGLLPAAACAWNIVSGEDISSSPVSIGTGQRAM